MSLIDSLYKVVLGYLSIQAADLICKNNDNETHQMSLEGNDTFVYINFLNILVL